VFTRHTNDVTDEMADDVTGDLANLTDHVIGGVTDVAGRGRFALRCTLCERSMMAVVRKAGVTGTTAGFTLGACRW
jgi:hypothetical protein